MFQIIHKKLQWKVRKLVLFSILFLLGNMLMFGNVSGVQQTFAQTNEKTTQTMIDDKIIGMDSIWQTLVRVANIILRPLLMVCGWAMDNSMVYWSVFWFDSALWIVRNLTKNLANFFLAFLFIYTLLTTLFAKDKKVAAEFKKLITNTLIAGILIQASRFLMASAVDISTIATYGIGWLPITILGQSQNNELNIKYPRYERIYNLQKSENSNIDIMHTKTRRISPCARSYYNHGNLSQELIIWRQIVAYQSSDGTNNWVATEGGKCHYYGQIYRFTEGFLKDPGIISSTGQEKYDEEILDRQTLLKKNTTIIQEANIQKLKWEIQAFIDQWQIVLAEEDSWKVVQGQKQTNTSEEWFKDPKLSQIGIDKDQWWTTAAGESQNLKDVLSESQSYVWVMTVMYGQLLVAGDRNIVAPSYKGTDLYVSALNTLLNLFYIFALVAPLLALAVVLVVRVVILWVLIAICPIWIVLIIFKKEDRLWEEYKKYLSLAEVIKLLLAPVLITFAVSMCTVFVFCLQGINSTDVLPENKLFLGMFSLTITGGSIYISKIVINMIGIAIIWSLLFWAIKSTKLWEKVGGTIESFVTSTLTRMPIIPFGSGKVWLDSFNPSNHNGVFQRMQRSYDAKLDEARMRGIRWTPFAQLFEEDALYKATKQKDMNRAFSPDANYFNDTVRDEFFKDIVKKGKHASQEIPLWENNTIAVKPIDLVNYADRSSVKTLIKQLQKASTTAPDKDRININAALKDYFQGRYTNSKNIQEIGEVKKEDTTRLYKDPDIEKIIKEVFLTEYTKAKSSKEIQNIKDKDVDSKFFEDEEIKKIIEEKEESFKNP